AVLLVKPQFEVGRERVGKGGVVRDPLAHRDAITAVIAAAEPLGWGAAGLLGSPITGPAGNHEYLLWLKDRLPEASNWKGKEPIDDPIDGTRVAAVVAATLGGG
ncbi:MAG: SAM-dependent methyltransferase, partial [Cyanobium sp.]